MMGVHLFPTERDRRFVNQLTANLVVTIAGASTGLIGGLLLLAANPRLATDTGRLLPSGRHRLHRRRAAGPAAHARRRPAPPPRATLNRPRLSPRRLGRKDIQPKGAVGAEVTGLPG